MLWKMYVSEVFIGYPKDIAHKHSNEHGVGKWGNRKLIQWLRKILEECRIRLHNVDEAYTSKTCSICGEIHENFGIHRGLYLWETHSIAINTDINAAGDMARNQGHDMPTPRKTLSFYITSRGLRSLTPRRGNNPGPIVESHSKELEGVITAWSL